MSGYGLDQTMRLFPLSPASLSRVFRAIAVLGVLAAVTGVAVGWALLGQTEVVLRESLTLTDDTLEALDASAGVAADSVATLGASLTALRTTAENLDTAFDDGEALMDDLAELVRRDVADSIGAVDDALPGLIQVAGTIDATLSALSTLPFGPDYDPQQSFADSLRTLSVSLDGLPDRLREQANQIEVTGESLGAVGEGVGDLVEDLAGFDATLGETTQLLDTYGTTIRDGRELVGQAADDLGRQVLLGRVALLLFALAFASLQVVPLHLAATATHPPVSST